MANILTQNSQDNDASQSNVESSLKIIDLNIDCFDEIFEYLDVESLYSFGQTCKRMNKIAGEYFKQNYSASPISIMDEGIYMNYTRKDQGYSLSIEIRHFSQFMPRIVCNSIYCIEENDYL